MMECTPLTALTSFNNILYIGDEASVCLCVIEKFNGRLSEIENFYQDWFCHRIAKNKPTGHDRLQYHIKYHFEGGIAVFKFRDEDELPAVIRKECLTACSSLAREQLLSCS